nr:transposase [Streptomyces syringium]
MASRLVDGDEQHLLQLVNRSAWHPAPVRRRIADPMRALIRPTAAWVIDDVSFPKDGRRSVGVAPQAPGPLGKRASCQVAVTVDAVTAQGLLPLAVAPALAKRGDRRRRPLGSMQGACRPRESRDVVTSAGHSRRPRRLGPGTLSRTS